MPKAKEKFPALSDGMAEFSLITNTCPFRLVTSRWNSSLWEWRIKRVAYSFNSRTRRKENVQKNQVNFGRSRPGNIEATFSGKKLAGNRLRKWGEIKHFYKGLNCSCLCVPGRQKCLFFGVRIPSEVSVIFSGRSAKFVGHTCDMIGTFGRNPSSEAEG